MNCYVKILSLLCLTFVCQQIAEAENSFTIRTSETQEKKTSINKRYDQTSIIRLFPDSVPITGLSVSGNIIKHSKEYLARIILQDVNGGEYLVFESYEELISDSAFNFKDYCVETALLNNVNPDCIKIVLKDASLFLKDVGFVTRQYSCTGIEEERMSIRRNQVGAIVEKVNTYNKNNNRLWFAGETSLSLLDYQTKKKIMGFNDDESTRGFEYYIGGIFEVAHTYSSSMNTLSTYIDSFDWRNCQGKNWMTSVKNQEWTSFCSAFSALGCAEALINLYYNKKIDMDLSEQELADCAHYRPHACSEGLKLDTVFRYIVDHGVCKESDYPMDFHCGDYTWNPVCLSSLISSDSIASFSGYNVHSAYESTIKETLMTKGPLVSGWVLQNNLPAHAMTLTGWGTVHAGDTIRNISFGGQLSLIVVGDSFPQIGKTYWIFKNSYGLGNYGSYDGYCYVLFDQNGDYIFNMLNPISLNLPTHVFNYSDNDIVIEDLDEDGYYNWGISPNKPLTCPVWVPNIRDDDDSDPTKVSRNEHGFLNPLGGYPLGPVQHVDFDETFAGDSLLLSDIEIYHGRTLTITGTRYCMEKVKIVCDGGTILIDGGVLANADIRFTNTPASLIIRNNGALYLKANTDLEIPVGCTVDVQGGNIYSHQKRL